MSYTFSGITTNANAGGNSVSVTLNIGATVSPFVVVGIVEQNSKTAGGTVTVGGVTLNPDVVDPGGTSGLFSGIATGQSGSVTVTFTATASIGFETVAFSLWYTSDPVSKSHVGSVQSGSSFTMLVNANDFMFAIGESGSAFDFNSSTVVPSGSHSSAGGPNNTLSADWTISSPNASFSVAAAHSINAVAATYGVGAVAGAPFGVLGLASCDW